MFVGSVVCSSLVPWTFVGYLVLKIPGPQSSVVCWISCSGVGSLLVFLFVDSLVLSGSLVLLFVVLEFYGSSLVLLGSLFVGCLALWIFLLNLALGWFPWCLTWF